MQQPTHHAAAVTNVSKSFTDLLNEGVGQTTYMTAAHSSTIPSGDFQLFPTVLLLVR